MPEPTDEQLHVAGLKAIGWIDRTPAQWDLTHYRWKHEGRDLIAEIENKLLVMWNDRQDYLKALELFSPALLESVPSFPSSVHESQLWWDWFYRQATPEACLRALHAIGKLGVK